MSMSTNSCTSRASMISVTMGMPVWARAAHEQLEARLAHALVGVGARARLERAAAQHRCAPAALQRAGDVEEAVALHGAGPRDDLEVAAAHRRRRRAMLDHGVLGMELAVGELERLGHARHRSRRCPSTRAATCRCLAGVADQAHDGRLADHRDVDRRGPCSRATQMRLSISSGFGGAGFDDRDHGVLLAFWARRAHGGATVAGYRTPVRQTGASSDGRAGKLSFGNGCAGVWVHRGHRAQPGPALDGMPRGVHRHRRTRASINRPRTAHGIRIGKLRRVPR